MKLIRYIARSAAAFVLALPLLLALPLFAASASALTETYTATATPSGTSCPSDYNMNDDTCTGVPGYDCPAGDVATGDSNDCVSGSGLLASYDQAACASGNDVWVQGACYTPDYVPFATYNCPDGTSGSYTGPVTCSTTNPITTYTYSCTNGGTLNGSTCTITDTADTSVTYSDSQSGYALNITNGQTVYLDGSRGATTIASGGVLGGSGTVQSLDVASGGTLSPGHSPGTVTATSSLTLEGGSTYQVQLQDAKAGDYDQTIVGSSSDTTGHDVTLGDGSSFPTLNVSLYGAYSIKTGDTFEIIDNLSQTSVSGTFNDLPEGATFTVSGDTFSISYVGGDGNDVVLTATSVLNPSAPADDDGSTTPKAPDTGMHLVMAHPLVSLLATTLLAAGIALLARRMNTSKQR